jgi:hypothetical protein
VSFQRLVWSSQIFHVERETFDEKVIASPHRHVHRHAKGASEPHGHPGDQAKFFDEVAKALAGSEEVLVLGPSTAKLHLVRHLHQHHRAIESKIVGLETADHPTDGQLVKYVRQYFRIPDARVG